MKNIGDSSNWLIPWKIEIFKVFSFFKYRPDCLKIWKKIYNMCLTMKYLWWDIKSWTRLLKIKNVNAKIKALKKSQKNSHKCLMMKIAIANFFRLFKQIIYSKKARNESWKKRHYPSNMAAIGLKLWQKHFSIKCFQIVDRNFTWFGGSFYMETQLRPFFFYSRN